MYREKIVITTTRLHVCQWTLIVITTTKLKWEDLPLQRTQKQYSSTKEIQAFITLVLILKIFLYVFVGIGCQFVSTQSGDFLLQKTHKMIQQHQRNPDFHYFSFNFKYFFVSFLRLQCYFPSMAHNQIETVV